MRIGTQRAVRDVAHERCRDCDLHRGGGLTLDYADTVEFLDAFKLADDRHGIEAAAAMTGSPPTNKRTSMAS
jgi:hypothetical protein